MIFLTIVTLYCYSYLSGSCRNANLTIPTKKGKKETSIILITIYSKKKKKKKKNFRKKKKKKTV